MIQEVIEEQLKKLRITLADIKTLDSAATTAEQRLSAVRASMSAKDEFREKRSEVKKSSSVSEDEGVHIEEVVLKQQIESLHEEK